MHLVRWQDGTDGAVRTGRMEDGKVVRVDGNVLELARRATAEPGWMAPAKGDGMPLDRVRLLAPIERPPAFRDFYAFERHVASARSRRGLEMDAGWYERPVFYFSNPAVLLGPDDEVGIPPRCQALDFELELGWVVGFELRGVDPSSAGAAVVGYTVVNDWSARDVQREEMRQSLGPAKGKDFATSVGPALVTADEFDASHGSMRAWVNGAQCSEADLSECWWSVAEMTAYAAEGSVVCAGDLFGSGTCGSGCLLELSLPWLGPGDVVELEIEGIGRLRNRVGSGERQPPWAPDRHRDRP